MPLVFAEGDPDTQVTLKHLDQVEESAEAGDLVNEVFENMENVNSSIEKGDKQATVKAIDETEKHLKHEEQIDVNMK